MGELNLINIKENNNYSIFWEHIIEMLKYINELNKRIGIQRQHPISIPNQLSSYVEKASMQQLATGLKKASSEIRLKEQLAQSKVVLRDPHSKKVGQTCLQLVLQDRTLFLMDSKIYDVIEDGQMIEIYDVRDHTLINGNFLFEELCPYSKLITWFYPFEGLYERSNKSRLLIDKLIHASLGKATKKAGIPPHLVKADNLYYKYQMHWFSSALDEEQRPMSFVVTSSAKLLRYTDKVINI